MVWGFTKSDEGVKAYADIGKEYDYNLFDELYEKWLRETTADNLSKYTHHKTKEVVKIERVKTEEEEDGGGAKGKEYLLYSLIEYRLDAALNVKHWWLPNIGKYPIPIPRWETTSIEFGKVNRRIAEIANIETGFSIPFTKANLDKIRDIGLQPQGKVQYAVGTFNGIKTSVATYDDLRDEEDFEALVHFGKKPTLKQRQAWLEGKGREKDLERLQELQRIRQSSL
ncbi:MAG: hypothetical protein ACRD47_07255 [Nitrososphaeraceae archaeon]